MSFMQMAIDKAREGVANNGGPFGAVITKNNRVIAAAHNQVTIDKDPTAHAEIVAIREACKKLDKFTLEDCVLWTSCEMCPMCFGAAAWARIPEIYYYHTRDDAHDIGFDDAKFYNEINKDISQRSIKMEQIKPDSITRTAFQDWIEKENKTHY